MEPTQATGANEPHYESSIDTNRDSYTALTDGSGVDATDLTAFQRDILSILAEEADYGLAIKRALEEHHQEEVNHGRLYPNLDELVELGLVGKRALDKRTNEYSLTDAGETVLEQHLEWQMSHLGLTTIEADHRHAETKPTRADGGEEQSLGEEMAEAAKRAGLFGEDDA